MLTIYYISTKSFTVCVECDDNILVRLPPILRIFQGQHIRNLISWLKAKFKEYEIKEI